MHTHWRVFGLLGGLVGMGVPALQAWWSMFFDTPMIPTLLGQVEPIGLQIPMWLVLVPPILAIGILGFVFYSITKPRLLRPFAPAMHEDSYFYEIDRRLIQITNGSPAVFHRCYARVVDFKPISQSFEQSNDLPRLGDQLLWAYGGKTTRPFATFTSLDTERVLVATFDRNNPGRFAIPIGINTARNVPTHSPYQVIIEIGSEGEPCTPTRVQFTIHPLENGNGIELRDITELP